jgi:hypothetical protein
LTVVYLVSNRMIDLWSQTETPTGNAQPAAFLADFYIQAAKESQDSEKTKEKAKKLLNVSYSKQIKLL